MRERIPWRSNRSGMQMRAARFELLVNSLGVGRLISAPELVTAFSSGYLQALRPFPGALETLRGWSVDGLAIQIVTEGHADIQFPVIESLRLDPMLTVAPIVTMEDGVSKADGSAYRLAMRRVHRGRFLAIGDSWDWDMAPAARLGLDHLWISSSSDLPEPTSGLFIGSARSIAESLEIVETWRGNRSHDR